MNSYTQQDRRALVLFGGGGGGGARARASCQGGVLRAILSVFSPRRRSIPFRSLPEHPPVQSMLSHWQHRPSDCG